MGAASGTSLSGLAVEFADTATGRTWRLSGPSLGLAANVPATLDRATALGRGLGGLLRCSLRGRWIALVIEFDAPRLEAALQGLGADVDVVPGNASLDPETGEPREGHWGRLLDMEATTKSLDEALGSFGRLSLPLRVELVIADVPPRGDLARLAALDRDPLATFSTRFDASETGRSWNIVLAAARLDGTVVEPGGSVSFNSLVGARTPEAGFRQAPELVANELVPGWGGGVCQVATTLFNVALLADLSVAERYHHSRPLAYIGLGRDATVSYPNLDLVIQNPRAFPVVLTAWVRQGDVGLAFWGRRTVDAQVTLTTEELNLKPAECVLEPGPELPAGTRQTVKEPFDGRDVRLWRAVFQAGMMVRRELVWVDRYEPIAGLVRVGPAQPSAPATPAVPSGPPPEGHGSR
jgi:vancomycin resistance protein YoaR